ncbi:Aste57867_7533 [Aphanomyces stellatus]|uniref:Aste57867_7533 protein n=1 Tax=Aphanomyces stellatus TaxID=120398 RepID=A0A485KIG2_9STRA|nr:hypothetical protein As57867_007507 [Aphanomyces stellatus]VFT84442.1 Aste57867_7533 [Aphanomyces stellatus]
MLPSLFLPSTEQSTVIATTAIAGAALFLLHHLLWKKHPLDVLPGPPSPSFLFGHVLETKGSIMKWHATVDYPEPFLSWVKQYGGAVHYREFLSHLVSVTDPKAIQHILVTHAANYPRGVGIRRMFEDKMFGVGLLSSTGAEHDRQRKMLNPHFSQAQVKTFVPIFLCHARLCCDTVLAKAADTQTPLNMSTVFQELTLAIIGRAAFGFAFDQHPQAHASYERQQQALPIWIMLGQIFVPKFSFFPIPQLRKYQTAQRDLGHLMQTVIAEKMQKNQPMPDDDAAYDLLDLMLPSTTSDEALVHTMTFMTVGHDTTSSALGWVFAMLATRPAIVARLRREIAVVMESHGGALASWDAIHELEYMTAVIQESLRFNTVVNHIMRRVAEADDHVPMADGSTIFIPKVVTLTFVSRELILAGEGTGMDVNLPALHRNPRHWANANAFVPERFVQGTPEWIADEALRGTKHHTFVYMPFAFGAGNCIGQKFALAEIAAITATLIREFDFGLTKDANTRHLFVSPIMRVANLDMTVRRVPSSGPGA